MHGSRMATWWMQEKRTGKAQQGDHGHGQPYELRPAKSWSFHRNQRIWRCSLCRLVCSSSSSESRSSTKEQVCVGNECKKEEKGVLCCVVCTTINTLLLFVWLLWDWSHRVACSVGFTLKFNQNSTTHPLFTINI